MNHLIVELLFVLIFIGAMSLLVQTIGDNLAEIAAALVPPADPVSAVPQSRPAAAQLRRSPAAA